MSFFVLRILYHIDFFLPSYWSIPYFKDLATYIFPFIQIWISTKSDSQLSLTCFFCPKLHLLLVNFICNTNKIRHNKDMYEMNFIFNLIYWEILLWIGINLLIDYVNFCCCDHFLVVDCGLCSIMTSIWFHSSQSISTFLSFFGYEHNTILI